MSRLAKVTELRVGCPHCKLGFAPVQVIHQNGADTLRDLEEPRRCTTCKKMFKLHLQINVVGIPLDSPGPATSQGEMLRNILGGDGS